MKIAVLSDIHGNNDALKQVLADVDDLGPDSIVCLGDCIGYGPEPQAVIDVMRHRGIATIAGNHELAACDPTYLKWFNPSARRSLEMSLRRLNADALHFIGALPTARIVENCHCVHGFPPDSALIYLFQKSAFEMAAAFSQMSERICFVGHTHALEIVSFDGREVKRGSLALGITQLSADHRYIINVGSVGQPRDGSPWAKYVVWDGDRNQVDVRAVDYDVERVVRKILATGLPVEHARRLR